MLLLMLCAIFCTGSASHNVTDPKESFTEELLLRPLYSEHVYAFFHFTTSWEATPETINHPKLFPRIISEIMDRHHVDELHVSLTGGLWRYESWGYPIIDAAPGLEVWAWFKPTTNNVDEDWKLLSASLSGLLCASINFVDHTNSVQPTKSLRPRGWNTSFVVDQFNNSLIRYAALPREIVCTENLTPWKKLLPCGSFMGIGQLLNSGYIHNTRYHSLGLHIYPSSEKRIVLQQTVSLVYDYVILGYRNWSLRKLFGQGVLGACPLATPKSGGIFVDLSTNNSRPFDLSPVPNRIINNYAVYSLEQNRGMNLNLQYQNVIDAISLIQPPMLVAHQYITGYGHQKGGLAVTLTNNHWAPITVTVLQPIPWFTPVYLHTQTATLGSDVYIKPQSVHYIPSKFRQRMANIETIAKLPPRTTCTLAVEFDYVFLKWQEYPPDANHGFYIGSALITAQLPLRKNFTGWPKPHEKLQTILLQSFNDTILKGFTDLEVQIRTETLVVTLPTPDFSMPYNVICLACTVVALAFGPLHNITTKRLVLKIVDPERLPLRIKRRIFALFTGRFSRTTT